MMRAIKLVLILVVVAFVGGSCLNGSNAVAPVVPTTNVAFYQGSSDAPAANLLVNSGVINLNPLFYTTYLTYLQLTPTTYTFGFTNATTGAILVDSAIAVSNGMAYTLFLTGTADNRKIMVMQDNGQLSTTADLMFRFVNLVPDSPLVDLVIVESSKTLFSNIGYRTGSDYYEMKPDLYTIEIRAHSDGHLLISYPFTAQAGQFYTLNMVGFITPPAGSSANLGVRLTTSF